MKKFIAVLPVLFVIMVSQTVFGAGPGTCPGGRSWALAGSEQGQMINLQFQNICSGSPETITGIVTDAWVPGSGLTVTTDNSSQTLFGLGPIWYWDLNNIDRPEIGESVSVLATGVTLSDRKVILSITIDDQTIELRNPQTCLPVWRGQRVR